MSLLRWRNYVSLSKRAKFLLPIVVRQIQALHSFQGTFLCFLNICGTSITPWLSKTKQDAAGRHTSTDNTTVFFLSNKEQDLHTFHLKEMLMQKTQKTKLRNRASIPESALLDCGRSSNSRGPFWASFPARHQGTVRNQCSTPGGCCSERTVLKPAQW